MSRVVGEHYVRGRLVRWDEEACCHVWADTGMAAASPAGGGPERPCPFCGETAEEGGPDPCLGLIPGVESACCGHGEHEGWIRFDQGPQLAVRIDYPGAYAQPENHLESTQPDPNSSLVEEDNTNV